MTDEILDIINDSSNDGKRLNEIVDEFRRGRNAEEILVLLDSRDSRLIAIGALILSELPSDVYSADLFTTQLKHLTSHTDPVVRFNSLSALYPHLKRECESTMILLKKLSEDTNPSISHQARTAIKRIERQ